jgi:hypothetical protein
VKDGVVVLEVSDSEVHLEGLERGRLTIEKAIRDTLSSSPLRVQFKSAGDSGQVVSGPPRRLDRSAEQQERLKQYREKDPALDAIAEALDLEVIE